MEHQWDKCSETWVISRIWLMCRQCSVSLVLHLYIEAHWRAISLAQRNPRLCGQRQEGMMWLLSSVHHLYFTGNCEIGIYYNRLEYIFHMNILYTLMFIAPHIK